MSRSKYAPVEALDRAKAARKDPKVKAWMRRARKLFKDQPMGTWVYWQESSLNLIVLGPDGEQYVATRTDGDGSDQAAVIDSFHVPGSDAGAW